MAKTKLERLVESLPVRGHTGRKKIAKGLYFDFPSKCYYFYIGKRVNENSKSVPNYYIENDPIRMEQFISDYETTTYNNKIDSALRTQETLKQYLTYFIDCQRYNEKATLKYYELCNKRISNVVGNIKLCDFTADNCERYIKFQLKHYSPATVRKDYDFLHMALTKAVRSRKIAYNPIEAVIAPKTPSSGDRTGNIRYYSSDDASKIISYCTEQAYQDKDNKYHNEDPNNIYSDGSIPHPGTISQHHKKIILESGVKEPLDFKALRHTFATLSRDGGDVAPFDLQDVMGHASIKTTEKYYLGQTKIIKTGALNSFKKMVGSTKQIEFEN